MEEKVNYSETLNLPKTDFQMRGGLPKKEPEILETIFENSLYEKALKKNEGHKHFVLHDGPPYANGEIHAGHALNKILKDTIIRYKTMQGFYSPFVPGYDTHGMPTEKKAIEKLGLDRNKIPVTKFRDTCKEFTKKYKDIQTKGFKRLGVLGDWDNPYITYDINMEARQLGVFGDMYKKGYIYRGLKPVYWCTDCETALAEAEIEYKDVTSTSIYVKFEVKDSKGLFDPKDTYFVIWTTTPWTLPGNLGIAIGKDYDYSLIEVKDGDKKYNLIFAKELVKSVMELAQIKDYKELKVFKGEDLAGVICKHPFLDRDSKVVLGSVTTVNVELTEGTGAVHTAPGYGKEDYLLGLENDLGIIVTVDEKGIMREGSGKEFEGMFYKKANKAIVEHLRETGNLLYEKEITHSYPHCWRCKKPIIFRATDQWFASIGGFRDDVLKAIKTVKWNPKWGEERITDMIKNRGDWCISRQRTWGVPLPIFYCKHCNEAYITDESIKKIQDIVRKEGTNAWWDKDAKELLPEGAKCKCGHSDFAKETDIMDVWFDSGSTHQSVLVERGLDYPADLYLEGNDQYRGWYQSSLLTSVSTNNKAPYKEILCCGMVVDGQGKKMSKSLGNGVSPEDVCNKYGADILRLWVLSSDYTMDVSLSDDILKSVSEVYRKIRNTVRFILGNCYDFDPNKDMVKYEDLLEIDRWALTRLNKLVKEVTKAYDHYEFGQAYHSINQFCVVDMSSQYLDIIKDRLYTENETSLMRRSAQTTMYYILDALVKMLTPMTAFTAEEIWKAMKHFENEEVESPMLTDYPKYNKKWEDKELAAKWKKIIGLKTQAQKELELKRAEKVIGNALDAKLTISVPESQKDIYTLISDNFELIKESMIVSDLELKKETQKDEITMTVEHAEGEKCERCWKYSKELENGVCKRCHGVLESMKNK